MTTPFIFTHFMAASKSHDAYKHAWTFRMKTLTLLLYSILKETSVDSQVLIS